ncbi:sensor histidine kinase [Campylobacter armoricus]|uniref:sensor histidine kinase n=1 Tax=Campylobacter armoricus TaxID=2505970 RepID=UPI001F460865|nr:HAMP domain-containing sensor histidine kinase [Campylobacter armoricus]
MLKIKTFFLFILGFFCISFFALFYFFNESYINTTIKNTYEQKLKTLNDVLQFQLLKTLNPKNINQFATDTRADFIIKQDDYVFSSLKDYSYFLNHFESNFTHDYFKQKEIYFKAYTYKNYQYIIIVYPKISSWIQNFWIKNIIIFSFFLFILILFYFVVFKLFKIYFQELLLFVKNIKSNVNFTPRYNFFDELRNLNLCLLKIKKLIIKQELKNKKQAKKIQTKNTQLSNVISAISHELKNPISVIDLSLQSLKETNDKNMKLFLLEKIHKQSAKINQLTHKLNFVFNLNLNSLNIERFDLYALSKNLLESFREDRLKIQGQTSFIKADKFLIEQVIINLIDNALKYSKKDILIIIENQNFTIIDQGIGIEEKHLKFITKKFYKANSMQNNSFGLGLFLVKKILSLHKSSLKVQSSLQKGSIFSFCISL